MVSLNRHLVVLATSLLWHLASSQDVAAAAEAEAAAPQCAALPLPAKTIFQFNSTTWIENIAARRNGDLLFTLAIPKARVYLVSNPSAATTTTPRVTLLHEFPDINSLRGIAEPRPDVFVVAGGTIAPTTNAPVAGTFGVYELAFQNGSNLVATRKVVDMPDAQFLNGAAAEPNKDSDFVLVGDSRQGLVYRVDIKRGTYEKALQTREMAPIAGVPPAAFGVNGMKIRDGTLLFDNTNDKSIYRVKLGANVSVAAAADASGGVEKMGAFDPTTVFLDDFDVGADGVIWAAAGLNNTILAFDPVNGKSVVAAGSLGSLTVGGPTSAIFGRGKTDGDILYVATSGAQGGPVNGTVVEPAKVVRIDTSGFAACRTGATGGSGSSGSSSNSTGGPGSGSSGSGTGKDNGAGLVSVSYVQVTLYLAANFIVWFLV